MVDAGEENKRCRWVGGDSNQGTAGPRAGKRLVRWDRGGSASAALFHHRCVQLSLGDKGSK